MAGTHQVCKKQAQSRDTDNLFHTIQHCKISFSTQGLANDRSENVEPLFRTKGYHFGSDSYPEFSPRIGSYDSKPPTPSKRVEYKNQLSVNCEVPPCMTAAHQVCGEQARSRARDQIMFASSWGLKRCQWRRQYRLMACSSSAPG